jgi:hypothetical protein
MKIILSQWPVLKGIFMIKFLKNNERAIHLRLGKLIGVKAGSYVLYIPAVDLLMVVDLDKFLGSEWKSISSQELSQILTAHFLSNADLLNQRTTLARAREFSGKIKK